jgi:energy-coupling factor transporter ATP-binding protein EcfA2
VYAGTLDGRLEMGGLDVARAPGPEVAGRVGLVFQDPSRQLVMDRVEDDVAFGLENRAWSLDAMRARVPQALGAVAMAHAVGARTATLSGGEGQRVALAGALAPVPGLLVLDEPTANLDPAGAEAFAEHLSEIRRSRSSTLVLIEHRVDLVWDLADRLLVLGRDGRLIAFGAPDTVLEQRGEQIAQEAVWLPRAVEARLVGPHRVTDKREHASRAIDSASLVLDAKALEFAYIPGHPVVRDVTLRVRRGERIGLVGPNGSGKSTLGRLLVGLLEPNRGSVHLFGARPDRLAPAQLARRAGYVFQDPEQQFLTTRVDEEVSLGLTADERARVPEVMRALELPIVEFGARSPYQLSGGEQRRLSLACCLVREPPVLVLDEPTFGQDRRGYEGLLEILATRVDRGAAVIAATHDTRFVADFARRVVQLDAGRVVNDTDPA